jgi:tRNA 2-thiouridine synthesizing protein D
MKYTIQINSSPTDSSAGHSAYQFIITALKMKHKIYRIFFYQQGVYHAFKYSTPPDDEWQMTKKWTELAKQYEIDLVVCISAAQRRGLLSEDESKRQEKLDNDLAEGFRISGLGQLLEGMIVADRFINFG